MKATKTRKVQTNKRDYMSDGAFGDIKKAMEGALTFERGERRDLKVTRIQTPRPPKAMSPKGHFSHPTKAPARRRCLR